MFDKDCKTCALLKDLLDEERGKSAALQRELLSLVKARLYQPTVVQASNDSDYYGVDDEMVEYNEFGDKVIVKPNEEQ